MQAQFRPCNLGGPVAEGFAGAVDDELSPFAARQAMEAFMPELVFSLTAFAKVARAQSGEFLEQAANG